MTPSSRYRFLCFTFRLLTYLADRTNGAALFVRPKLLVGAMIVGMGLTACDTKTESKLSLKSVKQSGNSKFHPEVINDSINIINKESNPPIKKERRSILEPNDEVVYCYDIVVNQDTSITNRYIEKLPIKQDGENIIVDQMPEFQGGNAMLFKYIEQNLVYPEQLQKEKIEGSVICSFIVGEDSTLSDIKIVRSLHPLLDEEAIRIVKSFPKWNPGKQNGIVVPVRFTIPILFTLPDKKK